jgi:hypothetical protein
MDALQELFDPPRHLPPRDDIHGSWRRSVHAGRITVMAVTPDVKRWARPPAVGNSISLRELYHVLDPHRSTSLPTSARQAG